MKRLLLGSLSVALLSAAIAPVAQANETDTRVYGPEEQTDLYYENDNQPGSTNMPESMDSNRRQPMMDSTWDNNQRRQPMMDSTWDYNQRRDMMMQSDREYYNRMGNVIGYNGYQTSPFELSYQAYYGLYENQGINGFATLLQDVRQGETDPEDIVQAGIATGRVNPEAINDADYVDDVEFMLERLILQSGD